MARLLLWFCAPTIALIFFGYLFAFPLQMIGGVLLFIGIATLIGFAGAKDMEAKAWALTRERQAQDRAAARLKQQQLQLPAVPYTTADPLAPAMPLASLRFRYTVDPGPPGRPPRRRWRK